MIGQRQDGIHRYYNILCIYSFRDYNRNIFEVEIVYKIFFIMSHYRALNICLSCSI